MGYAPVTLNRLAPELTGRMVAKIFATDLNRLARNSARHARKPEKNFVRAK